VSRRAHASAPEAFSAHAREYDALRRRLVPSYDALYGAVTDALALAPPPRRRVLDLGAGTGLLAEAVIRAHPGVTIELLDASEPMLAQARRRLGAGVAAIHIADMSESLPAGPFDAVVSALAIHHLDDPGKQRLFARVHAALAPGGAFVNLDQVAGPDEMLDAAYRVVWDRQCAQLGATPAERQGARERMRHDRCADVESHLRWLRSAGFESADCVFKAWRFAVIAAFKEAAR
jgi:tRNA (cmo5U34)-methyltransferase